MCSNLFNNDLHFRKSWKPLQFISAAVRSQELRIRQELYPILSGLILFRFLGSWLRACSHKNVESLLAIFGLEVGENLCKKDTKQAISVKEEIDFCDLN